MQKILVFLGKCFEPIRQNLFFFVVMYLLGCVTSWLTLPHTRGAKIYENLYTELFFDLATLCLLLYLMQRILARFKYAATVVRIVKGLLYTFLYIVALADVYCFVTYDTSLTPTVMMLMMETTSSEAGEFVQTLFSTDVIFGKVGYVLLILLAHMALVMGKRFIHLPRLSAGKAIGRWLCAFLGLAAVVFYITSAFSSWNNKVGVYRLLTARNIGEVEHLLTAKDHGTMYQPAYRFAFSAYANTLTAGQVRKLQQAAGSIEVDSCSYKVPHIVLIIGESFSRHHSQQYGYWQPTTPRQVALEKTGRLVKFSDVVCPWNLTSFVFKLLFSTYTVGDKGEWCDYPLFPELFKASGYHVTFLTNQFLPKAKEAVYDFSGGFFLNDETLSKAQFDARNTRKFQFDEQLLDEYEHLKPVGAEHTLTIFHLIGQHVLYRQRSPQDRKRFHRDDYKEAKPHLNARERQTLADYDNSILYNDSVITAMAQRFDDEDAIVVHLSDHGEECYEGDLHFFCRMHSAEITSRLAHAEFDIPFWIYCTPKFIKAHPDLYGQIRQAKDKPYMTDALPHMLLYLAGIHSKDYREEYNILSTDYDSSRPRILKNTADYDKLDKKTKE